MSGSCFIVVTINYMEVVLESDTNDQVRYAETAQKRKRQDDCILRHVQRGMRNSITLS